MFLTESTKEINKINSYELIANEYINMYEDTLLENSLMLECVNIEHKALLTEDAALIQEAENQVQEKQEGLWKKICAAVKAFIAKVVETWNNIVNSITGLFSKENADKVQKNMNTPAGRSIIKQALIGLGAGGALAGVVLYFNSGLRTKLFGSIKSATNNPNIGVGNIINQITGAFNTVKNSTQQIYNKIKGQININTLTELATKFRTTIGGMLKEVESVITKIEGIPVLGKAAGTIRNIVVQISSSVSKIGNWATFLWKKLLSLKTDNTAAPAAAQPETPNQANTAGQ